MQLARARGISRDACDCIAKEKRNVRTRRVELFELRNIILSFAETKSANN